MFELRFQMDKRVVRSADMLCQHILKACGSRPMLEIVGLVDDMSVVRIVTHYRARTSTPAYQKLGMRFCEAKSAEFMFNKLVVHIGRRSHHYNSSAVDDIVRWWFEPFFKAVKKMSRESSEDWLSVCREHYAEEDLPIEWSDGSDG